VKRLARGGVLASKMRQPRLQGVTGRRTATRSAIKGALPLYSQQRTSVVDPRQLSLSAKKRLVHRSKSGMCRRTIDGGTAVDCGVLLNDFELTDLGAWRQMSDLLVKLAHDAEVHHGADDLDVCGLKRAAKYRGNLVAIALARSQVV
jgi:hypothetical protein